MKKLTDKDLIILYQGGNNKAFETLIERHKVKVYNYIFYQTYDIEVSKDIFQETFFKAIIAIQEKRYFDSGKFISWIFRIAHNLIIDFFYQKNKVQTYFDEKDLINDISDSLFFSEKSIEDILSNEQVIKDVLYMVKFLPSLQQEVIKMRFFQNLSYKEIAEKTNVSTNTALGRMTYALINLRKIASKNDVCLELK